MRNCIFSTHLRRMITNPALYFGIAVQAAGIVLLCFGKGVYFVDEARGIRKMIVDFNGWIQDFPGIVQEDFWVKQVNSGSLMHQVRFRSEFGDLGDKFIMRWQIQPDGRYWEDEDGFGMTPEEEIQLYTYIDLDGNFTGPFRIYRIGSRRYCEESI